MTIQIQLRRDTAANWTSANPTLAQGELGFETDTGKYKLGTGTTAWNNLAYNDMPLSTYTTKGDLIVGTGSSTAARLAAGANGYTLVADSSTSTGLAYSPTFFAGKNKIINGDFGIWQRGTSFTPSSGNFTADRWNCIFNGAGATRTISQQSFTPGTAPVSGYEGTYFIRFAQSVAGSGGGYNQLTQPIEDVRTLAGQVVSFSFWAKAASNTTLPYIALEQYFGSGGSADGNLTLSTSVSVTTSWQRFTFTGTLPSISGKTIGTGSYLKLVLGVPVNSTFTIDFWGVQLEAGSTATPFQTATGTIQGELAACQRYYFTYTSGVTDVSIGVGTMTSASILVSYVNFPVTMRTTPTLSAASGVNFYVSESAGNGADVFNSFTITRPHTNASAIYNSTEIAGTAGQATFVKTNSTSASIAFSAEL